MATRRLGTKPTRRKTPPAPKPTFVPPPISKAPLDVAASKVANDVVNSWRPKRKMGGTAVKKPVRVGTLGQRVTSGKKISGKRVGSTYRRSS